MPRRKKPKGLRPDEIQAIVEGADQFHCVICQPLISPDCAHYDALHRLGEAMTLAISEQSGQDAPWMTQSSSGPSQGERGGHRGSRDAEGDRSP